MLPKREFDIRVCPAIAGVLTVSCHSEQHGSVSVIVTLCFYIELTLLTTQIHRRHTFLPFWMTINGYDSSTRCPARLYIASVCLLWSVVMGRIALTISSIITSSVISVLFDTRYALCGGFTKVPPSTASHCQPSWPLSVSESL